MYDFRIIKTKSAWDEYANSFVRSTFINSWTWGEFQRSLGVTFLPYAIFDRDSIEGLIPIKLINAKRGRYLHIQHGPLIEWDNKKKVSEMMSFLQKLAQEQRASLIRMSPLLDDNEQNRSLLKSLGMRPATAHEVDAEHTLVLDLTMSEKEILDQMRKNTRYYIRKAEKIGIKTEIVSDLSKFDIFWEIFIDAVKRNKWVAYSRSYIENEFKTFAQEGKAKMFLSSYNGKYISAAIFTYFNEQSFYHHSGSLTQFRDIPSTYALQWEAIKYAKNNGCREHNFWGVVGKDDTQHPWYGLSLFKRGFGGSERQMVHAHDLVINLRGNLLRTYEFIERKSHGY